MLNLDFVINKFEKKFSAFGQREMTPDQELSRPEGNFF